MLPTNDDGVDIHCAECNRVLLWMAQEVADAVKIAPDAFDATSLAHKKVCPSRCHECSQLVSKHTMDDGDGGLRRLYCP